VRVTTIDGGFRGRPLRGRHLRLAGGAGLGALSTAQQNSEAEAFIARFTSFDRVRPLIHRAVSAGALPIATSIELEAAFLSLGVERDAHINRLQDVQNEAQLTEWRSTAASIAARATALADHAGVLVGDETGARPWKIAVALVVGGLVFGGAAYAFSRAK